MPNDPGKYCFNCGRAGPAINTVLTDPINELPSGSAKFYVCSECWYNVKNSINEPEGFNEFWELVASPWTVFHIEKKWDSASIRLRG